MTAVFWLSLFLFLYPFFLYPPILAALARLLPQRHRPPAPDEWPTVSLVVPVRNGEGLIQEKIRNSLALDYPPERLEILVASDGSADETVSRARALTGERVRLLEYREHEGKNATLNKAVPETSGEILLLSDADARLERDALQRLVSWFRDPTVGGVCGRKVLPSGESGFGESQATYNAYEERLKKGESRLESITTNEGKIHALRRALFQEIPPATADDLFNLLAVVRQGRAFVYEDAARAFIPPGSLDPAHEIKRRKRIVSGSLRALWANRELFHPFRHGRYAWMLLSHKVGRRLAPVFMILATLSSLYLAAVGALPIYRLFFWGMSALVLAALLVHGRMLPGRARAGSLGKLLAVPYYFCLGNWGTLLGVADFLKGSPSALKWETRKERLAVMDPVETSCARNKGG
ncbi:MAG: glycosyltransferase [Planctomycetota bacterium]